MANFSTSSIILPVAICCQAKLMQHQMQISIQNYKLTKYLPNAVTSEKVINIFL